MTVDAADIVSKREARIVRARQRGKLRKFVFSLGNYGYPVGSLLTILILWQVAVVAFKIPGYLLPAPVLVIQEAFVRFPLLVGHAWITAYETILGFLLSVAVGVPLAVMIVTWRIAERTTYPLLVASQTVPKIAIAPLLVVWLGFGITPKILVAFLIAFFPVVISTVVGLKSVQMEMLYLGKIMGLNWVGMFTKISLPNALPSIFGGFKVAITLAVVGAIVGEFVGADKGLGYLLIVAIGQLNTTLMFADLLFLIAIGVIFFAIVEIAERMAIPWHVSARMEEMRGSTM